MYPVLYVRLFIKNNKKRHGKLLNHKYNIFLFIPFDCSRHIFTSYRSYNIIYDAMNNGKLLQLQKSLEEIIK